MKYLADAFEAIEDRGGVIIRETSDRSKDGNGYYSKHAQAYVCTSSKEEINEMQQFTSITSHDVLSEATTLSKTSTAVSNKLLTSDTNANDRLWSVAVGVDSSARHFSGLSETVSGGSNGNNDCLGPIDEALTSTERQANDSGTLPSRLDSDIVTVPSRLDSDIGTTKSIKSKDTWESNNSNS